MMIEVNIWFKFHLRNFRDLEVSLQKYLTMSKHLFSVGNLTIVWPKIMPVIKMGTK